MKPYGFQQESVDKFMVSAEEGFRGFLNADDMGTGKTVQSILFDLALRRRWKMPPTLVAAPMGVLPVWRNHYKAWAPKLKVCVIDPRDRWRFQAEVGKKNLAYDVYILHWDSIRLLPELQEHKWGLIIGDEIHRIGNRDSQVAQTYKKIRTHFKLGASGTPATTRPEQYWSVLNWLYPREFSSYWRFYNHHVIFVAHSSSANGCPACFKTHRTSYREIKGIAHEDELNQQMGPWFIRRLKEDVLKDLPEKYFSIIPVQLAPKQRRMYDSMRKDMLAWVGENEDQPLAAPMAIAKLVRLQQLSAASAEIVPVYKNIKVINDDMALRYQSPVGTTVQVPHNIVKLMDPSSKLDAVMQIVQDNPGEQLVVFSASKQVINLLGTRLAKAKIRYGLYTGDTSPKDRDRIVEAFQDGQLQVFAGTISAGGEGITLTAASTVVFIDRVWSPSKNEQTEDRLHRIGQKNAVHVIDLVAEDTVDLGRLQHIEMNWSYIKRLLGDTVDPKDFRFNTPQMQHQEEWYAHLAGV